MIFPARLQTAPAGRSGSEWRLGKPAGSAVRQKQGAQGPHPLRPPAAVISRTTLMATAADIEQLETLAALQELERILCELAGIPAATLTELHP